MKNKKSVFITVSIVFLMFVSVGAIALKNGGNAGSVKITADGESVHYSLERDMLIEKNGVKIKIEDGKAYITESTCRDKICINAGKLGVSGDVAVCLPNKVTVSISQNEGEQTLYSNTFTDTFDTVVTLYGYSVSKEEFGYYFSHFQRRMRQLSDLFDAFNKCEVNNLYTVNSGAGIKAVAVDKQLAEGVIFALEAQKMTEGYTDPSFGAVTGLWRDFINGTGGKPDSEMLKEAFLHCGVEKIEVDNDVIYIADNKTAIDVGATAKGYCAELVADELLSMGFTDFCINAGGNVVVRGNKKGMNGWEIGIQDPFGATSAITLQVKNKAVVTSGSYRRYRDNYNHIINVKTLYPADRYASVSVICDDSGVADAFSTALFCMDTEQGKRLAKKYNLEVIWITKEGDIIRTDGC